MRSLSALTRAFTLVALTIAPICVSAQSMPADSALPPAFLRRREHKGGGRYYDAPELAKLRASDTRRLLARISGADARSMENGEVVLVSRRGVRQTFSAGIENELCRVGIMVNERLMPDGFDLNSIALPSIMAVEFYSGPATIPPDLNSTGPEAGRCGLLVVWVQGQ